MNAKKADAKSYLKELSLPNNVSAMQTWARKARVILIEKLLAHKFRNGVLCQVSHTMGKNWTKHEVIREPRIAENVQGRLRWQ